MNAIDARREGKLHKRLRGDTFLRSVIVLVSGTAGAHLIAALAMPVLSRLYTPEQFGVLAAFSGIVATASVAACLRFDVALALPESERDAFGLLLVALAAAAVVSMAALLVLQLMPSTATHYLPSEGQMLIPLGIFAAAACSAIQNWSIREKAFGVIAKVRVAQSLSMIGLQVGGGALHVGALGLVVGSVANTLTGALCLGLRIGPRISQLVSTQTFAHLKGLVVKYRRFPIYSTAESLANQAAIHLPVVFIAGAVAPREAGHLMLAMYAMQAPMSLIGSTVAQVYLSHAPQMHRDGRLGVFTLDILTNLAKAGLGPLLLIGALSPIGFELIFGDGWGRAGTLVAWMTPWFVFQFLASPVSMALHVTGRQRTAMFLQIIALLIRAGAVWGVLQFRPDRVSEAYAVSGFLVYGIYLWVVMGAVRATTQQWGMLFRKALIWALPWGVSAGVVLLVVAKWLPQTT